MAICGYIDRKGGLTPGNICTVTGLIPPSHSLLAMCEFTAKRKKKVEISRYVLKIYKLS